MASKFKPTTTGVSSVTTGQAPSSSQGPNPKPLIESEDDIMPDENETGSAPVDTTLITELRTQLSTSEANGAVLLGKLKEFESANQSRLTLEADRSKELLDARTLIAQQAGDIAKRDQEVAFLRGRETELVAQISQLNKAFSAAGTSTLSDLPEDCYQLNESAKIGVFLNKQIVGANANKDDVLVVGDEKDAEHYGVKLAKGGRRIYAVEESTIAELSKLGFLYQ